MSFVAPLGSRSPVSGPGGLLPPAPVPSVGGEDLIHPAPELGHAGVDGRSGGGAAAASPGDDADQSPGLVPLTDQRAARVALQGETASSDRRERRGRGGGGGLTMQDVAPAPPAQIITSEMLLPQCLWHCWLDSRGRAACCSLLGVLGAEEDRKLRNGAPTGHAGERRLTVVAGQTPPGGDAGHSSGEDVAGVGETHGRHVGAQTGGAGQLDEGDVIVDGAGVPVGVCEHLDGRRG